MKRLLFLLMLPAVVLAIGVVSAGVPNGSPTDFTPAKNFQAHQLFQTADACMSCHNGIVTDGGEDISFGSDWRASMMANSARDPYWHAAVRREIMDHPESQVTIEKECSTCHMPMAHYEAVYNGQQPQLFAHLPIGDRANRSDILAADGVSCTVCHQITEEKLGSPKSFVGNFVIDTLTAMGQREVFGPYPVDSSRFRIMHSSSGFLQRQSRHIQLSEVCATCHTLITESLGPKGEVVGQLPEQVPYKEWQHSSFAGRNSCQSCHMPVVNGVAPIASVMGQPKKEVSRHTFVGANAFMLKMLNRYRHELGVQALPRELDNAALQTIRHLQSKSARINISQMELSGDTLVANISITNLAGHKLPTGYPSRRSWITFTVRDQAGTVIFESGKLRPDGSIEGNDNDENARAYEPHYRTIKAPGQVQIYETIMADPQDSLTTGLLTAVRFIKDNRITPEGFDKATAEEHIAVQGQAFKDDNFVGGGDAITYYVDVSGAQEPLNVHAELWYQPIAFRWAQNLVPYDSRETNRFVSFYDSMSEETAVLLAETSDTWSSNE